MRRRAHFTSVVAVTLVAGLFAGCSLGGSTPAPIYGGDEARSAAAAKAPNARAPQGSLDSSGSAPRSAARLPGGTALDREPRQRPGLGTTWGETRSSHVRHRSFDRASARPFAHLAVYYNDAEGISAQMAYRGGEGPSPYYATTPSGDITVALEDEHGRVLVGRRANGRTYVVGREGERYSIVVRNHSDGRFEVVASVDGLDVIDGRPASTAKRGYLLPPHGKLVIDGFRRSDAAVAAFRFGRVADSYAARTSGGRNVGVIGVAFFCERGTGWTPDELHRRETADPFPVDPGYSRPPPARVR